MRLSSLRIDGYGLLADLELGPLAEGLSVIVGPNEAGKSTLLDFLRGVLFGFPDRRYRHPFHEPLHGGRHGGAVQIVDDAGTSWTLERHLDRRAPLLSGPDGAPSDATALLGLLGGADDALFRSVFAFGLGELASFDSLDGDGIRELVFSAGVLGAGRSAAAALRSFEQQRQLLVRPRQQEARANELRRRLEELDGALRSARAAAGAYATGAAECDRLRLLTREAREEAEAMHARARELQRLESCWVPFHRGEEARAALQALGALPERSEALASAALEIRSLGDQLSGHEERRGVEERLRGQLSGIERSIELHLAEVGFDPTVRTLPALDIGLEEQVSELAHRQREAVTAIETLDGELGPAEGELSELEERAEALAGADETPSLPAITERLRAAQQLRGLVATLDRLEAESTARRHEAALTEIASGPRVRRVLPAAIALIVAGLVLALAALAGSAGERPGLFALAGLALIGALALLLRQPAIARRPAAASDGDPELGARLARVRAAVAERSGALGLGPRPEGEELDALFAELDEQRERRREADELDRARERARLRVSGILERRATGSDELRAVSSAVERIAEKLELSPHQSPEALRRAVHALRQTADLIAASARVSPELAAMREATAAYESHVTALFERLGLGRAPERCSEGVAALSTLLDEALAARTERAELARHVASANELLGEVAGGASEVGLLRSELSRGALDRWAAERRWLDERLHEGSTRYERCLAAQLDAERALGALASSEEIVSLAQEREHVAAELDEALDRWLALGLAARLVQGTLSRYEAERQPLVISRAGALFSEVTGGAYDKLVVHEEADARRHGIVAITPSGQRVDASELSRGSAEQLYLCLRLAFAATFAERSVALPLVLDDVLVNFDPARAAAMTRAIARVAEEHQVIVFTCHPHLAEGFTQASAGAKRFELSRR